MHETAWEALGTHFKITIWEHDAGDVATVIRQAQMLVDVFDRTYSRFKPDSLVSSIRETTGTIEVPEDLTRMLAVYATLSELTNGRITPTVGAALEDAGYDARYSLRPNKVIRHTPAFHEAIRIIDPTHIELSMPVLIDLGALGKGYIVDRVYDLLRAHNIHRFLVDGSGDIRYHDRDQRPIVCALEHPLDATSAIGTKSITHGSICASGINRRAWEGYNHYLDPHSSTSPTEILATWVYATDATTADGLSSALFFTSPEILATRFDFEYLILDHTMHAKSSTGFAAELFTA